MSCNDKVFIIGSKINQLDKEGKKVGTWLIKEEETGFMKFDKYKKGKKNGLHKTFTIEGKLLVVGQYKNDQKVNKWIYYSLTDGRMNKVLIHKNDSIYELEMVRIINTNW
jgi:antitoxin component YwqK of YwqJK toxin-antitoxin module